MDSSADFGCLRRINEIEIVSKNHVRAHPRHICGFFMSTRVFGGQTVGQGYYAFKKLYPESTVVKIDTNFIAPGNGNEIIDFFIDLNSLKFGFTKVEVKQKEKIIAYCNIRFTLNQNISKEKVFLKNPGNSEFPYGIDAPLNYRKLVKEDAGGDFTEKHGTDKVVFEIRPLDSGRFLFYEDAFEDSLFWIRVNPDFSDVKITDPLLIPLIMTDYFIFHPALSIYVLYERTMEAVNGASLNHTVNVHCDSPDIDPHGFFLIQTKCNTISRQSSIIDGRIFDEKKRLILTYRQQNYTAP